MDQISKIVNVHLIDLKFEEELHITSLNSTNNFVYKDVLQASLGKAMEYVDWDPALVLTTPKGGRE